MKLGEPAREKFKPDSLLVCYTIFRTDSKLQPVRGARAKAKRSARLKGCAGHHQPLQLFSPSTYSETRPESNLERELETLGTPQTTWARASDLGRQIHTAQ